MSCIPAVFCWILAAAASSQPALPEGEGKATVETLCTGRCHGPDVVVRARRTPAGWETTMNVMIDRGAEMTDTEYDIIFDYLSTHLLATVNVNTGTAQRIAEVLEMDAKAAAAIVSHRERHGRFRSWQEVAKVPGVEAAVIEERRARLEFE
jgi:competence ComEA-like helix-hairpin-helix protein